MAESSAVKSKLQIKILESDPQSTGVRDWNSIKKIHKPPRVSEVFRAFLIRKIVLRSYRHFSDIFQRLLKISEDFRQFPKITKKIQRCWKVVLSTLRQFPEFSKNFRKHPKISEDFGWFPKIWKNQKCRKVVFSTFQYLPIFPKMFRKLVGIFVFCTVRCFFLSFPKNFQTSNKGDINLYFR